MWWGILSDLFSFYSLLLIGFSGTKKKKRKIKKKKGEVLIGE